MAGSLRQADSKGHSRTLKHFLGPLVLLVLVIVLTTGVLHAGSSEKGSKKGELDWNAYTQVGQLAVNKKDYDEAEVAFKKALVFASQQNKGSLEVAKSLDDLAKLYQVQGRYLEAEPLFRKAIELYQKRLGRGHALAKEAIKNLAILYESRGQTLDIKTVLLPKVAETAGAGSHGNEDGYTEEEREELAEATKMNDLALLYKSRRNYSDAEPLYQKALDIYERIMGTEHPNVAITLSNLAQLAKAKKNYKRSENLYLRALVIYKTAFGNEHLAVATTLTNLGILYGNQGYYAKAEPLFEQALAIREKNLGPNHPKVLKSLTNLAIIYENQDKFAEAKPVYERALRVSQRLFPSTHPVIRDIREALAEL